MKILRTIFVMSLFMAVAITANAQLTWGVKAGLNVSSLSGLKDLHEAGDDYSYSQEQGNKAGFHVGVNVQYMLTPQIGIESGLFYSTLGTKLTSKEKYLNDSDDWEEAKWEGSVNPSYLQLPVSFLYKFNLGQDLYLYPSVGLCFGYGLSGKLKGGEESYDLFSKMKVSNGETEVEQTLDKAIANRFNIGLTAGLTLQYSNFTFGLGYEQGLSAFNNKVEGEYFGFGNEVKNRNFNVSVGYFF